MHLGTGLGQQRSPGTVVVGIDRQSQVVQAGARQHTAKTRIAEFRVGGLLHAVLACLRADRGIDAPATVVVPVVGPVRQHIEHVETGAGAAVRID